jgi:hypothetical protein
LKPQWIVLVAVLAIFSSGDIEQGQACIDHDSSGTLTKGEIKKRAFKVLALAQDAWWRTFEAT